MSKKNTLYILIENTKGHPLRFHALQQSTFIERSKNKTIHLVRGIRFVVAVTDSRTINLRKIEFYLRQYVRMLQVWGDVKKRSV